MGDLQSAPKNFKQSFQSAGGSVEVEFVNMNIARKYLYQVWVPFEGKKVRFHLQRNEKDEFKIAMMEACPEPFRSLEKEFAEAIISS